MMKLLIPINRLSANLKHIYYILFMLYHYVRNKDIGITEKKIDYLYNVYG
jgi:hypothetical protein